MSVEFIAWLALLFDQKVQRSGTDAPKQLDRASTSIALNIAEGNGKRSAVDRARIAGEDDLYEYEYEYEYG